MNKESQAIIKALIMYGRVPEMWELLEEIERLNNIIKEVREYILSNQNTELSVDSYFKYKDLVEFNDILEILDKGD